MLIIGCDYHPSFQQIAVTRIWAANRRPLTPSRQPPWTLNPWQFLLRVGFL